MMEPKVDPAPTSNDHIIHKSCDDIKNDDNCSGTNNNHISDSISTSEQTSSSSTSTTQTTPLKTLSFSRELRELHKTLKKQLKREDEGKEEKDTEELRSLLRSYCVRCEEVLSALFWLVGWF
eukprot:TRINITY_DN17704_c0_g1_i1.p1 TRINITY_DN17704_c0_g1~~TRINITY_DN17704_c0_g1_i1.p1  ORF type:complete len:122 (-),score=22.44 TRINITY_DN17704_c0_g1_i1:62-427(-)